VKQAALALLEEENGGEPKVLYLQPLCMVVAGAPAFKMAAMASRDLHLAAHTMIGMS
jgi:hypothetical protein